MCVGEPHTIFVIGDTVPTFLVDINKPNFGVEGESDDSESDDSEKFDLDGEDLDGVVSFKEVNFEVDGTVIGDAEPGDVRAEGLITEDVEPGQAQLLEKKHMNLVVKKQSVKNRTRPCLGSESRFSNFSLSLLISMSTIQTVSQEKFRHTDSSGFEIFFSAFST